MIKVTKKMAMPSGDSKDLSLGVYVRLALYGTRLVGVDSSGAQFTLTTISPWSMLEIEETGESCSSGASGASGGL